MTLKAVSLSEKQVDRLQEKAEEYGVSFSEALRRTLDEAMEIKIKDEKRNQEFENMLLNKGK